MTTNADGWARPELICETDWLAEHIDDDDVVVLDCDLLDAYLRLHIPGAVWSLSRYWKTDPRDDSQIYGMSDPEQWAGLVGRLGITPDTTVVAYDGSGSLYAARTWWTFDRFGHKNFKILHGGLDKWYAEGRPLSRENLRPQGSRVSDAGRLRTMTRSAGSMTFRARSKMTTTSSGTCAHAVSGPARTSAGLSVADGSRARCTWSGWTRWRARSARSSRRPSCVRC